MKRFNPVLVYAGTPPPLTFSSADGTPIVIDSTTNKAYYNNAGTVTLLAGGGGGTGTVTSVSASGTRVTGAVTNATTTPNIALALAATTVAPGSYTNANITVQADGTLTAAANGSASADALVVLTDGATIAVDCSLGNHFRVTLTGAGHVVSNPINIPASGVQKIFFRFLQDGTGGWTNKWGSKYLLPQGLWVNDTRATVGITYAEAEYQVTDDTWIVTPTVAAPSSTVASYAANIRLLLHMQGPTLFTDDGPLAHAVGTQTALIAASSATLPSKWGSYSGNFTGGGAVWFADSNDWDFGSGDFTVQGWANFNASATGARCFLCGQASAAGGNTTFAIIKSTSNGLFVSAIIGGTTYNITAVAGSISAGGWYFFRATRSVNTLRFEVGTTPGATPATIGGSLTVSGAFANSPNRFAVGANGDQTVVVGTAYGNVMLGQMQDFELIGGTSLYGQPIPVGQLPDH